MRFQPINPMKSMYLADATAAITLPALPQHTPMGFEIEVVDNLGTAGTTNIVVSGPINGSTSVTLSANFVSEGFIWTGAAWAAGVSA
ncbi:MAG: hypothetical protein ACREDY_05560 [Bradyrhizobium sp.]